MPSPDKPMPVRHLFAKVEAARQVLRERAEELINEYIDISKQAKAAGDYESAYKALQWLIDHIPATESGERVVDRSVDKTPEATQGGSNGPQINIGIQLGGIKEKVKQLPKAEVIDVKPVKSS